MAKGGEMSWESHGKTMENHGKTMENHGKTMEHVGKMGIEPPKVEIEHATCKNWDFLDVLPEKNED